MAVFRTQNHVPDVYTRKSRDFQLFCNLFDCVNGGIKYDIDSIIDVVDTNQCNERLIPYLQTKLGFWTDKKISAENLRTILKGFVYAVRNKGSIKGVEQAVQIFLKVIKLDAQVHIEVINETNSTNQDPYTVIIGTDKYLGDTTILDEILKYIIPSGYAYRYVYYANTSFETGIQYSDSIRIVTGNYNYEIDEPGQSLLGAVRTIYTDSNGNEIEYPYVETIKDEDGNELKRRSLVDNVNMTVVASNKVPVSNDYENSTDIRNPEVEDSKNGPVTKQETIDNLYNDSQIGEQNNGN